MIEQLPLAHTPNGAAASTEGVLISAKTAQQVELTPQTMPQRPGMWTVVVWAVATRRWITATWDARELADKWLDQNREYISHACLFHLPGE